MNNLPVKRTYRTKKRILAEKKAKIQISINKVIILILSVVMAVGILGFARTHTDNYITSLGRVQRVHAVTIPELKPLGTIEEQITRIATEECNKRELGDFCVKDMLAIAWTEARFDCTATGDFGSSHGCYQIHQGYHKDVTQDQAEDLSFAIPWTLDRMIKNGYPVYRSYAVRKHNGSSTNPKTKVYLDKVNSYERTD